MGHALDPRRLTGVTDAANNVTTIGYDLLGRKTGMTEPDMGSWQYGYDNAGNLTSQRDGANRWLYLEYDALNRLIRKRQDSVAGAILAEWLYDATGQLRPAVQELGLQQPGHDGGLHRRLRCVEPAAPATIHRPRHGRRDVPLRHHLQRVRL